MAEFNAMDTAAFKGVWVFCEQREGEIQSISYQLLSEGRKLANDLGVELCGVDALHCSALFRQCLF
mgnify:FL=1